LIALPFLFVLRPEGELYSGFDRAREIPGSAVVPTAVFGVPPNTFRHDFHPSAANAGKNPQERIGEGVGRESRPTAIGTIALPKKPGLP